MDNEERWVHLLSTQRLGSETKELPNPARSLFQRDFDRIVFSSAFRRLQDKTQVFPLAESDYVRTRLTHSLETSCVGRSLGSIVGNRIIEKHDLKNLSPADFGSIVAAASLAHDIGNPPFGHSGEDAIRNWAKSSDIAQVLLNKLDKTQCSDIVNFEGNAQGFRVLTRLQNPDNPGGMQLTCAVLGAFTKYPRLSHLTEFIEESVCVSSKKHGFFLHDKPSFDFVSKACKLRIRMPDCLWQRHPLAYLVEAADDICYHIMDFEDGFRLGYVEFDEVSDLLQKLISEEKIKMRLDKIKEKKEKIEFLRAKAINSLIQSVADVFLSHEEALLDGSLDFELTSKTNCADTLQDIISKSRRDIYSAGPVIEIEAAGFEVIGGLLDLFVRAIEDVFESREKASAHSKKLLQLIPKQFLSGDGKPDADPYCRIIKMTDFVSGMTDSYAVSLFKKVKGISLPRS